MSTIYKLLDDVSRMGNHSAEYWEKMVHHYPKTTVKDRAKYILSHARDKRVLDVGCTGPLANMLQKIASDYHGIDSLDDPGWQGNYHKVNLDSAAHLPAIRDVDLIIAGEVIEHLSNAGHFLDLIREYSAPVILTTPNAYSLAANNAVRKGYENVNKEHVTWYSYQTLKTLVTRHDWTINEWFWYNGKPGTAEGLIFYMEPDKWHI